MSGYATEDDGMTGERFFDRDAHGGAGAEVAGAVRQAIQFRMEKSVQCIARGVMEMTDGALYTWTVRRPGRGDVIHFRDGREICRIATRAPFGTFAEVARGLLAFERDYIDPDLYRFYSRQVDEL